MLVGNHPFAADLAVANGRARPDLGSRAISPFSGKPVKTVTKGNVIARGDTQFAVYRSRRDPGRSAAMPPRFSGTRQLPLYCSGGARSNNNISRA